VAAELSVGQELVLAEIIFDGRYNDLTPEQVCALSSCFVWREKYVSCASV
jgi:ATP-dependent RNA helicase DOB1